MDMPMVKVAGLDDDLNYEEIESLIDSIKSYDGTSTHNQFVVSQIDHELKRLSHGLIGVRIWCLNDIMHCTVVYEDPELVSIFKG